MSSRRRDRERSSPETRSEERDARRRGKHSDRARDRSRSPPDRFPSSHHRREEHVGRVSPERTSPKRPKSNAPQESEMESRDVSRRDRHRVEGEREGGREREEEGARDSGRQREERWEDKSRHRNESGARERETSGRRDDERRDDGRRDDGRRDDGRRDDGRRDDERRKRREQRMVEDEEAKNYKFGGAKAPSGEKKEDEEAEKEEPNFALSGKLTAETNTYKGVVIKYSEPAEARPPSTRWRLYQFKGEEVLPTLYVHRQSAYLIGRDRRVVDVPVDHPSCSSQHAVLQYRLVDYEKKDGSTGKRVRPYLIDLESTNGTYINNQRIESARYWELKEKDMIKFGFSSREYVLLHENSHDDGPPASTVDPLS